MLLLPDGTPSDFVLGPGRHVPNGHFVEHDHFEETEAEIELIGPDGSSEIVSLTGPTWIDVWFETAEGEKRVTLPARHRSNNGELTRRLVLEGLGIALLLGARAWLDGSDYLLGASLAAEIEALAREVGFDLVGVAPVELPATLVDEFRATILGLDGVSGLALDITSKPPGTIEWE